MKTEKQRVDEFLEWVVSVPLSICGLRKDANETDEIMDLMHEMAVTYMTANPDYPWKKSLLDAPFLPEDEQFREYVEAGDFFSEKWTGWLWDNFQVDGYSEFIEEYSPFYSSFTTYDWLWCGIIEWCKWNTNFARDFLPLISYSPDPRLPEIFWPSPDFCVLPADLVTLKARMGSTMEEQGISADRRITVSEQGNGIRPEVLFPDYSRMKIKACLSGNCDVDCAFISIDSPAPYKSDVGLNGYSFLLDSLQAVLPFEVYDAWYSSMASRPYEEDGRIGLVIPIWEPERRLPPIPEYRISTYKELDEANDSLLARRLLQENGRK